VICSRLRWSPEDATIYISFSRRRKGWNTDVVWAEGRNVAGIPSIRSSQSSTYPRPWRNCRGVRVKIEALLIPREVQGSAYPVGSQSEGGLRLQRKLTLGLIILEGGSLNSYSPVPDSGDRLFWAYARATWCLLSTYGRSWF